MEASGPSKGKLLTASFLKEYYRSSEVEVRHAALSFLRAYKRAYIPNQGIFEIIMEIYIMSVTEGNNKLETLTAPELVAIFNELAVAAGQQTLKLPFKGSKKDLLARIEKLKTTAAAPTEQQQAAAASNAAKAEVRLAGLTDLKAAKKAAKSTTTKENSMTAKKPAAKPAAKAAAKPAKAAAPKKQGIGAFCIELIQKGKDNAAILEAVQKKFPDASTSAASIAWYRNKLKSEQ